MLTDAQCKNAKCPEGKKRHRLTDANGLYLEVSPAGSRRWFWKTYADGKEGRMALGSYPQIPLTTAWKARDAAKLQKSQGVEPIQFRKTAKLKALTPADSTFKATALEWYAMKLDSWSSHYAIREKRNLEKDLFPFLGDRNIADIEAIELLAVVRRVEERGALDVAHRVLTTAGQVWRYAVATGRAQRDVSADICGAAMRRRAVTAGDWLPAAVSVWIRPDLRRAIVHSVLDARLAQLVRCRVSVSC